MISSNITKHLILCMNRKANRAKFSVFSLRISWQNHLTTFNCVSILSLLCTKSTMHKGIGSFHDLLFKSPSTLIRFQTKTELFCCGHSYRPHHNAENDHRKRSHSKTLSRVKRFKNDAFVKRCFLVWTEKTSYLTVTSSKQTRAGARIRP